MPLVNLLAGNLSHGPCVVGLGAFDGVHRGHKALIEAMSRYAAEQHLPAVIFTFWGFLAWVYSVARLRARVVCPSCGKSLSYLLTNPSYSKQFVQFGIPSDLPEGIAACPYCMLSLDESTNGAQKRVAGSD